MATPYNVTEATQRELHPPRGDTKLQSYPFGELTSRTVTTWHKAGEIPEELEVYNNPVGYDSRPDSASDNESLCDILTTLITYQHPKQEQKEEAPWPGLGGLDGKESQSYGSILATLYIEQEAQRPISAPQSVFDYCITLYMEDPEALLTGRLGIPTFFNSTDEPRPIFSGSIRPVHRRVLIQCLKRYYEELLQLILEALNDYTGSIELLFSNPLKVLADREFDDNLSSASEYACVLGEDHASFENIIVSYSAGSGYCPTSLGSFSEKWSL